MRAREVLLAKAARVEQRDRERVAERHLRRGAGGRREVERAGLLVDRARDDDVGVARRGCCRRGRSWRSSVTPRRLIAGRIAAELVALAASWRSRARRRPASPCRGRRGWLRPGCTNIAGVPVEASVAAILRPTWPLLPMPITTTRPRHASIAPQRGDEAVALARLQRHRARAPRCRASRARAASARSASKVEEAGTVMANASSRIGRF